MITVVSLVLRLVRLEPLETKIHDLNEWCILDNSKEIERNTLHLLKKNVSVFVFSSVPAEISCFHDYGEKFALSLLYYLKIKIKRKNHQSDESKEILRYKITTKNSKVNQNGRPVTTCHEIKFEL